MLSFVQSFFSPKANPIGVDFGTDTIRMAQVRRVDNDYRLIAAASADVPPHARRDPAAKIQFFTETVRDLLAQGQFIGRQAVLAMPASSMYIQHLRLTKMDDESRKKAIPWEARGKLPIDPSHALLRHHVAGEVYQDQEPREEVILMAAGREFVNQLLSAAAKARLDVVGMDVEPKALVNCFGHVYRRKTDAEMLNFFVDIGCCGTRAVVARAGHILFARAIPVGGDHFNRAVADSLSIPLEEAQLLRTKLADSAGAMPAGHVAAAEAPAAPEPSAPEPSVDNTFALLDVSVPPAERERRAPGRSDPQLAVEPAPAAAPDPQSVQVDHAVREPLSRLVQELDLCRRYYEATFPAVPIDRLVFVGGEAHQRRICQEIAMELSLAAQVGDPMIRMAKTCEVPPESGLDRSVPQPSWAVALGLSMGVVSPVVREVKA